MNIVSVPLPQIDLADKTYSFSFPEVIDKLTQSIRTVGLIQPIVLTENRNSYQIVCGRRRVLACNRLGWKVISARLLKEGFSELDIFNLNLCDNLSIRTLNIIEKSVVINKLKDRWDITEDRLITEYLPLLEIPLNIKYLRKYLWPVNLTEELKQEIVRRGISLDTIDITTHWPLPLQNKILSVVLSFKLGNNKTAELLTLLNDISTQQDSPADRVLQVPEWISIQNNSALPAYQKGLWLRKFLLSRRYPEYTQLRDRIKQLVKDLDLPEGISIKLDELLSCENDSIRFVVKCLREGDLKRLGEHLSKLDSSPQLSQLLKMLRYRD